jgi:arylsulfatase A-like enzyme
VSVAQRPPYGSVVLAVARLAFDHDRDGYSPWFGGGDCDDHDPSVHPGAHDVPGNGVDENCSGADAVDVPAPPPPAFVRPSTLPERPNIVVILVDALRPDRLGFGGNPRPTSPNIDRFRAGATWFRRAYTPAPSTRFALSSIFTGLEIGAIPQHRGAGAAFELAAETDTIAEALDRRGYDRVGYTIAHVAARIGGVGQGFRVWTTAWQSDEAPALVGRTAPRTTDAALAYLASDAARARPFFLFLHYDCTHAPYARHPEHDFGPRMVDAYDGAVAYCDEHVGRVLSALDARADRDRTAIVLMSDHGELLGEQGLEQHGSALFEPAVRATLLVRVPGIRGPETIDAPVSLTDLHPTIAALAGTEGEGTLGAPDGTARGQQAWNLLALMTSDAPPPPRPIFLYVDDWRAGVHYEARAVVLGDLKLMRDLPTGTEQLFDEIKDPAEAHDLHRRPLPAKDRLRALLDASK